MIETLALCITPLVLMVAFVVGVIHTFRVTDDIEGE